MVHIGHINLATSFNGTGEHFVSLVESLSLQGVSQHVVACNSALLRRVAVCEKVTAGPATNSTLMASCLLPLVDVVHIHEDEDAQAGLLLKLTRSIPYVLTHRSADPPGSHPLMRSAYRRAAGVICSDRGQAEIVRAFAPWADIDVIGDISRSDFCEDEFGRYRSAADHLKVYRRATDSLKVPALLL